MRKYFTFSIILVISLHSFVQDIHAQSATEKVATVLQAFPYQHAGDADAALASMKGWDKKSWKAFAKTLDDDSLKVKASYALNAYVNKSSLDAASKAQVTQQLQQLSGTVKSDYAKTLVGSQLNLLTDKATIVKSLASLPKVPVEATRIQEKATGEQRLLQLEDQLAVTKGPTEKKRILKEAAGVRGFTSFLLVSKGLDDPDVASYVAPILVGQSLHDENLKGPYVRQTLERARPLITGEDSAVLITELDKRLQKMPYDHGFTSLFNGRDLTGWKALVGNPITRSKMSDTALRTAQQQADEKTKGDWIVKDGLLVFTGHGDNLCTDKKYGDFEMYVDWKITEKGDAGIYLRGTPQVQIWDTSRREVGAQVGSGGLYNNQKNQSKPLVVADNKIGEWNRFHIIMTGEKVTVYLNGVLVTDNVPLENYWDKNQPIFPVEQIELQAHGTYVAYRNLYLRELPPSAPTALSEQEKKEGFVSLFDGTNLDAWTGNTTGYAVKDGVVEVNPDAHGGGNLYTKEEYADFIYRFEFQLTPGANNGIGIRAPLEGDAAYVGMEIQVLDTEHPKYRDIHEYQAHGSVYGVIPAKRGYLLPTGEWNKEEIMAKGNKIKVTLNGTVIVDGDIKAASKNFKETADHKDHPGLSNKSGHLGFLGHGDVVRFRNMRVKKI
jgi:hypothetical protein